MVQGDRREVGLPRAGQADTKRLLQELKLPDARRAAPRDAVPQSCSCLHRDRSPG